MKRTLAVIATLTLAACRTGAADDGLAVQNPVPQSAPAGATPAARGQAFAEARCARCHGVVPASLSPNPDSPPFEKVANTPGLTRDSLDAWLSNAHDFPAEMYFALAPGDVDDLVAYILTLKRDGYAPPEE